MTFNEALKEREEISARVDKYDALINQFPTGNMGLISDEVRNSEDFKYVKKRFDFWFTELQAINITITRGFKKEYAEHRRNKRKHLTK